ncbi:MAG TPA: hypothetical protein VLM89_16110, partial [Phycisphaerae bacterium]|nr:hypothetical protein [Phycisphaerae bacterium]
MKLGRIELGRIDLIGACAASLIAAVGVGLLSAGWLPTSSGLTEARDTCTRLSRELSDAQTERQRLGEEIKTSADRLSSRGGGLPDVRQVEQYLASVTSLASASGIIIDSMAPSPYVDRGDHLAVHVSFTGRGGFPGFQKLLNTIEQGLDFADVTHFGISTGGPTDSGCRLEWSLRIHAKLPAPSVNKSLSQNPCGTGFPAC